MSQYWLMLYKAKWIVENESLCDEGPESECFISSLDQFNDPFKNEPDYIAELDDVLIAVVFIAAVLINVILGDVVLIYVV